MTEKGWQECILEAVRRRENRDDKLFILLAKNLAEKDKAMQYLTDLEYRCTGMGLLETVKEIERSNK